MLTIQPISYRQNIYQRRTPEFRGLRPQVSMASAEKSARRVEFWGRKIFNFVTNLFLHKQKKTAFKELLSCDTNSPEYIKALSKASRQFATRSEIEINLEHGQIERLAKSGKPHIFIMNHDSQSKDPQMLALFNTLLNDEYLRTGQAATCPRPQIILNEDILLAMDDLTRSVFKKLGAVPIDASIHSANKSINAKQFFALMKSFLQGKCNIFIFPEGRNSVRKSSPLDEKFQIGVAELVTKLADKLPEINVTPVGFAYNRGFKSPGDSIYIGKTVTIKKDGKHIVTSAGNIDSPHVKPTYKAFFNNREEAILTEKGVPVEGRDLPLYLSGVLCENLRICKQEAIAQLPTSSLKDKVVLC